jgi:hypothetical protein
MDLNFVHFFKESDLKIPNNIRSFNNYVIFYLYYNYKVNLASQIFITFVVSLLGLLCQMVFLLTKLYIHGFKKCDEWIKKSSHNILQHGQKALLL